MMSATLSTFLAGLIKVGWLAVLFNEVRGIVLAVPVLIAMYNSGGSLMAIWLGICSLAGIALSVIVPMVAARRLERYAQTRLAVAKVPNTRR